MPGAGSDSGSVGVQLQDHADPSRQPMESGQPDQVRRGSAARQLNLDHDQKSCNDTVPPCLSR